MVDICGRDSHNWNPDTLKDGWSLLLGLTQFEFVMVLLVCSHVMAFIRPLCGSSDKDQGHCWALESWVWFQEATSLAQNVGVECSMSQNVTCVIHHSNDPAAGTSQEYYTQSLMYDILDRIKIAYEQILF